MQEVETEEDPPLQQKAKKTETVPNDSCFLYWEGTCVAAHCICCKKKKKKK